MNKEQILICDPHYQWAQSIGEFLKENQFSPLCVETGQEIQKEIYDRPNVTTLIMNWATRRHSALEVLRYIKTMKPSLKIILIFNDQKSYDDSFLSSQDMIRLGITIHMIKPFNHEKISTVLKGGQKFDNWKDVKFVEESFEPEEVNGEDHEFTRIKLSEFANGARTVFDHYIKLGRKKYLKIINKGESFSFKRIQRFSNDDLEYLYFRSSERTEYINYLNTLIQKVASKDNVKAEVKINMAKVSSEMIIEEIYTSGLSPALLSESIKITEGIQSTLKTNSDVFKIIRSFKEEEPTLFTRSYLTSLFAGMICLQIPWAGVRTTNIVGQSCFLIDIGMMKLPPSERNLSVVQMKPDELKRYRSHPLLSVQMLEQFHYLNDSIRQVILDSHEYTNGEGFPKGKSGNQIYPLAKIVCFASEFAEHILKNKMTPHEGIKDLLGRKKQLHCYDAEVVKCFIASLTQRDYLNRVS